MNRLPIIGFNSDILLCCASQYVRQPFLGILLERNKIGRLLYLRGKHL